MTDSPKLILSMSDRLMWRNVRDDDPTYVPEFAGPGFTVWHFSDHIPGTRLINTWEVYHGIWLTLSTTEDGKSCIHRSINRTNFSLVHEHEVEIYNIFIMKEGSALFSAKDGWWITASTGKDWVQLRQDGPKARSAIVIPTLIEDDCILLAYGIDLKIYRTHITEVNWEVVLDMNPLNNGLWEPALAGTFIGQLAGVGHDLYRSEQLGNVGTWQKVRTFQGIIRDIVISDTSKTPVFLIAEETPDRQSQLHWTKDLGDTITTDRNRFSPAVVATTVYPLESPIKRTAFAILGRRSPDSEKLSETILNID